MARWIPGTEAEEAALLSELGLKSVEELFTDVPRKVRMGRLGIGAAKDEPEVVRTVDAILDRNRPYSKFANFMGGRISVRYQPALVDAILSRSEFYTSYTPYQPEASQGMLQSLFEFQSLWVELTGMDAANASLYDGATAAGEALLLARRVREGRRFLLPASLPWEEKSVLANYASGFGIQLDEIPYDPKTGRLDLDFVRREVATGEVFGVLADLPNGFGIVDEGLLDLKSVLGDIPYIVAADPLALTVLAPPGDWGADIVIGEGQGFGLTPSFGGPLLGLFACRSPFLRLSPGRIVGATSDASGRQAFTLTLQTREQHIRRSRATSNICTNQSLLALAFVVYASTIGPSGLAQLQQRLTEKAKTLASALGGIDGLSSPRFDAPYLGEFAIEVRRGTAREFLDRLRRRKVLGGHPLADPRPGHGTSAGELVLTAATEFTTDKDIQKYARAARVAIAAGGKGT
ncbi:MAG TPA: aminomethyl-transferring glycine dehydrogenase subunit GcvPA [Thermoplasmata archaeon]|nr:aminomethyl-transferring glycine dehydrogenase subunit GcvPA [Thermoplasmata archaeon]